MIAACPKCKTKFRVSRELLEAGEVRLRCTRCTAVFRVKPPADVERPAPAEPPVGRRLAAPPSSLDPERLVLVAIADAPASKATANALESWGLQAVTASDGVEAMLSIQRLLPRAIVLGAALPKMYGFQVCELVKRNESLRSISVVLVGEIHEQSRYRREPQELYGADVYLESPDLPDALRPVLRDFGLPVRGGGADVAAPPAAPAGEPAPAAAPDDGLAAERANAERLARIIVSDVILYNEQKFAAAVAAGKVEEVMGADLQEGRSLFQSRVDPHVSAERDYLGEELLRVARSRSTD